MGKGGGGGSDHPSAPTRKDWRDRQPQPEQQGYGGGDPASAKQLMYFADCGFSSCAEQSHKVSVPKATVEEQFSSKTIIIHPAIRAQLHLPAFDLSWTLSAARQSIRLWQPSSTCLPLTSPGLCQQQDNPSGYDSPAPPRCLWPLLDSVSSKTIHPAMTAQLHLPAFDLSWTLSAARQSIWLWQPSSTSLPLTSPGLCQQQDNPSGYDSPAPPACLWPLLDSVSSKTIHLAMTAQLHLAAFDLSWTLSAARQSIRLWQPSSTCLPLTSPGLCQQQDNPSGYDSPAPPLCLWPLLDSVSSKTIHLAMTAQLHLSAFDLSWTLSAARQSIWLWQPSSTSLPLTSPGLCQQQDNPSGYDSPAPPLCLWPLLDSVSSKTIHLAMTAQLHLSAFDLSWTLSAARQSIWLWQPSSTSPPLTSPGLCQQQDNPSGYDSPAPPLCLWPLLDSVSSKTIHLAMTAQLHLAAFDLSWTLSAARQSIWLWQPSSTSLPLTSPGLCQQQDNPSGYDSPAPPLCLWPLLDSVSSKTIHLAMTAQLHLSAFDLSWTLSAARQSIWLWQPSSTSLPLTSPGLCQQQDNPSGYDSPAPPRCLWPLLDSVSSKTIHLAMTAQLHLSAFDLSWTLSAARQSIWLWQPSSTSLPLTSPGLCQQQDNPSGYDSPAPPRRLWPLLDSVSSKTIHLAMTAQLHLSAFDLSWTLSAARQSIWLWQPSSTSLPLTSPGLCQQQDNPSGYDSPAPPRCLWPLLDSVSSKTIHLAMTAQLHLSAFDLSWTLSAARQSIWLWQPSSTSLPLTSPGLCQQQDNPSGYDSPAPSRCLWPLLDSVSSKTIHLAMTAQLHLSAFDLSWTLSAARQSIRQWQPSSTSLPLTSPGLCQQQDNPSGNDSPAPPRCLWPLLDSVSSKTIHLAMTAQLHLAAFDLSWTLSAARQSIRLWQPSSTCLPLTSPGLCQQQDNPSGYDSPAPPLCLWPLLDSVSSKTIHLAMTAQLHLSAFDLSWTLSAARQSIWLWQPSSTSLPLTSPGLCQQQDNPSGYDSPAPPLCLWPLLDSVSSKTIHPAMTAQLHLAAFDLSWTLSAARQSIWLWQPSSTSLPLTSPGLCQQQDNPSGYDSPAPPRCLWPLLDSVSSKTIHLAMTAQLHLSAFDLSWTLSAARQSIWLWQPSSTSLPLTSPGLCQQQDNPSGYDSPAPPLCLWPLLDSVSSKTIHLAMTAQLHLAAFDLSWTLSAARQSIWLWQPSSTSLPLTSPGLCQQQDNPSGYDSSAPPRCLWPLLDSVSSKTIHLAMTAQLHLAAFDLSWTLSAARQSIRLWQPSSTCLPLTSPGLCQQQDNPSGYDSPAPPRCLWPLLDSVSSKTIHLAMTAQLHLAAFDLSWTLSAARQSIWLWQPSSTSLPLTSPGLCQQQDNPSGYDSPAPPRCLWPLLDSVSSKTIHPAMTAQLHLPAFDLSWTLWKPSRLSQT